MAHQTSNLPPPGLVVHHDNSSEITLQTDDNISDHRTSSFYATPDVRPRHDPLTDLPISSSGDDVEKGEEGSKNDRSQEDPNVIEFKMLDESVNPMNWKTNYKWGITMLLALMTFVVTFTSSIFSTATVATSKEFNKSQEVITLGTSLYVMGFAFGPIVWGPLSELFGRRPPLFLGLLGVSTFQIGVAVAQNLWTILICRFFAGLFGSAPLAVIGGALADFWSLIDRGIAVGIFSAATFVGPVAAPVIGGFITDSYLGWRWGQWISVIIGYFGLALGVLFMPETYGPVILQAHAKRLRYEQKNWAIRAKADETQINLKVIGDKYLLKPFRMIIQEPILLLVTLYMGLVYGILYLFFEAFPISFEEERGWNGGVGALPFLSIMIGVFAGGFYIAYDSKTTYASKLRKTGQVVPENRLPPMIVGGATFTAGLFWWAWTSSPHITWVPQVIAGVPTGMGILLIFVQGLNYIIDVYKMNANSAIAANSLFRSFLGAGFPLFATAMYHKLGVAWATSLLGFLSAAMFPVPIVFFIYGKKVRRWSKFSPE